MFHFSLINCPHCRSPIEVRMFSMCSLLGPREIHCLKCRQTVDLGRDEWLDMTLRARLWFFVTSLIYIGMVGLLTGNWVDQMAQQWKLQPNMINLQFRSPVFQVAACVGGIAVLLIQIFRIAASRRRSHCGYTLTRAEFLLGLQWNLQCKYVLLMAVVWCVSKVIYMVRFPGPPGLW